MKKSYSGLILFETIEERFEYLRMSSLVGQSTFGFDRYLNQTFYKSKIWRSTRDKVIIRDDGCDLGVPGYDIFDKIIIHHMNPVTIDDIKHKRFDVINPEFLICVSERTHNAIHFGTEDLLPKKLVERRPNDTIPWKL